MTRVALLAAALLVAASPAFANDDCDRNNQSQMAINQCAGVDAANADAALNKIYKQLVAKLDGKEKTALRDAQRAWIAFRDKECEYRTIGDDGGSIRPMELAMCARDMTEARTKALAHDLACASDDKGCDK